MKHFLCAWVTVLGNQKTSNVMDHVILSIVTAYSDSAYSVNDSVAPMIRSVFGNTLYRLILSISVSDLYTCQIASRSDMVA